MTIDSQSKQQIIQSYIQPLTQDRFWIGIQQIFFSSGEFNYYWIDSSKKTGYNNYTFWSLSSPYDYKLRCVRVSSNSNSHSWQNYPCSHFYQSVCEFKIGKIIVIRGYCQDDILRCDFYLGSILSFAKVFLFYL